MKTLTFGMFPSPAVFEKYFHTACPDGVYTIQKLSASDSRATEDTFIGVGPHTCKELWMGLHQLARKSETVPPDEDDPAGSLASSIMSTLGFEWI